MEQKNIMSYESVLPENFDGTFRFTNWTDEDFIGKWGGKEYRFPAKTTSPILMTNHTPLEIQSIRKHFAKALAEREFAKSQQYEFLLKQERNSDGTPRLNSIHAAGTWSIDSLTPFIQRCLEPLPVGKVEVREPKKEKLENKLSRNDDGELNSEVIDGKTSLRERVMKGTR